MKNRKKRTSIISRIIPIPPHQRDRIRKDRPRHRIPTANPAPGAQRHAVLRLQAHVQLQIVHMPIQLPRRLRHARRLAVPLLKGRERLQAQELAELVHRAHAPRARLRHRHHLDDLEHRRRAARAVRACHLLRRALQDSCEPVVAELPVGSSLKIAEAARGG